VATPLLCYFNYALPTRLETNALDSVIASVLLQKQQDSEWHPTAFYSKTMVNAELNYPIHNKEMLAIVSSFQH